MKERYQICALCSGSIHSNHSNKYEYLNLINEGKTLYRKTDLFATGIEENFTNNHFICVDCIIERSAPIQLLIDDGLITEANVTLLNKNNLAYQLDEIIIRSNIIKYMPLNLEERKRIILNEK